MLDETGFKRKRFADLFEEMEDKAKEAWGDKVNTGEKSPLGIILRLVAWFLAILHELAEKVYFSGFVNTAEGRSLDRLGPYVGATRVLDQYAVGTVTLTGTPGYTQADGFLIATEGDVQFETLEPAVFDAAGKATVPIEAMESGTSGNVAAGLITVIVNPNPDVTAVTNVAATSRGRAKQTDPEFRELFALSVAGGGSATGDSIRGSVLRVTGVRAAAVIENKTKDTDSAGRPPKSYQVYVLGGEDNDVASAIFAVGSAGIESYGDTTVVLKDLSGNEQPVSFSRAEVVPIHIKVHIFKTAAYPADGDRQVVSALAQFIGGTDADGTVYAGLSMNDDVILMRLVSTIYKIAGVEDVSLELSQDGQTYTAGNIPIEVFQVAQTAADWIEVVTDDFSS
ncbi:putative phage protein gp47/JayE [Paenibacillus sp. PvP094]|uniref:baseplate J/gp47 family protein n=1 Tax=Paenibacillus sp. PvP094 TaxID=3156394 RepID=UPI003396ABA1